MFPKLQFLGVYVCRLAVLTALAACASDRGTESAEDVPERQIVAEGRIGSLDDPDQSLTLAHTVVIGPEEQLFVVEAAANDIRVYDRAGALTNTIGRAGDGPGEFRQLEHIWLRGDTLLASDNAALRVSAFSLDGALLSSQGWDPGFFLFFKEYPTLRIGYVAAAPRVTHGDTLAIILPGRSYPLPDDRCRPGFHTRSLPIPYLLMNDRSEVLDTLLWQPEDYHSYVFDSGEEVRSWPLPVIPSFYAAPMPDGRGVLLVDAPVAGEEERSPQIRVTLLGLGRDTLFQHSLSYAPVPMTEELVRAAIARSETHRLSCPGERLPWEAPQPVPPALVEELAGAFRRSGHLPATLPPVTHLTVTQDGSIWLRREETFSDSTLWQVLDPQGWPRGAVRLPSQQRVVAARGDLVVAREVDDFDVPYLVRYRLIDQSD